MALDPDTNWIETLLAIDAPDVTGSSTVDVDDTDPTELVLSIPDDSIADAKINSAAAIAGSKIAPNFDGQVVYANDYGFKEANASPAIGHDPRTTDAACADMSFVAQYPFASATGSNRTPAGYSFDVGAPTNGGTTYGTWKWKVNGVAWLTLTPGSNTVGFVGGTSVSDVSFTSNAALGANMVFRTGHASKAAYFDAATVYFRTEAGAAIGFIFTPSTSTLYFGASAAVPFIRPCTGTPEGALSGYVGSLALRANGGGRSTLYIKESGAGTNTGWVAANSEVDFEDIVASSSIEVPAVNAVTVQNTGWRTVRTLTANAYASDRAIRVTSSGAGTVNHSLDLANSPLSGTGGVRITVSFNLWNAARTASYSRTHEAAYKVAAGVWTLVETAILRGAVGGGGVVTGIDSTLVLANDSGTTRPMLAYTAIADDWAGIMIVVIEVEE
jgi:hypothetical protein